MMTPGSQEPPAWLRDDLIESHVSAQAAPKPSSSGGRSAASANNYLIVGASEDKAPLTGNKRLLFWAMKVVSLALCVLMSATAVIGLGTISSVNDTGRIYVALYMFLFSALYFVFELVDIYRVEWLDHFYRRNFGFLYSTAGKALFFIFIAFLTFGLGSPELLSLGTGAAWALYGGGIITLYLKRPDYFE